MGENKKISLITGLVFHFKSGTTVADKNYYHHLQRTTDSVNTVLAAFNAISLISLRVDYI